jgi:nucleolar GTP-binding protein
VIEVRAAFIPEGALRKKTAMQEDDAVKPKLERDIELEMGDDYILDLKSAFPFAIID